MDARRLVWLRTENPGGFGSGYLIGPQLVLTALHVVLPGQRWAAEVQARVGHPRFGDVEHRRAQVCWPDPREGIPAQDALDVALLWLAEPVVVAGRPVRWGRPRGITPLPFDGAGFPAFADEAARGDVEHLRGELPVVSTSSSDWVLDCRVWPDLGDGGERPWAGASGAAIFCRDRLVGVAVEDNRPMGGRRLQAAPIHEALRLPGFADLVIRHGHPGTTVCLEKISAAHAGDGPIPDLAPVALLVVALILFSYGIGPGVGPAGVLLALFMVGMAGAVMWWNRARRSNPTAVFSNRDDAGWLRDLRQAETDRVAEDLRARSIDVAAIAVPWRMLSAASGSGVGDHPELEDVHSLFAVWSSRVTPRLVLSGAAGSGKSIALSLLAKRILDEDAADGTVPVVIPLSGWTPSSGFYDWVAAQLAERYPEIVGEESRLSSSALLRALRGNGQIVPFLDGFDEMAPERRRQFVTALNQATGASGSFALASRTAELAEAKHSTGGFRDAVSLELLPLSLDHFRTFLSDSGDVARWEPLLMLVKDGEAPVPARVFTTPLMQWLGLQVVGRTGRDPVSFADRAAFSDPSALERHLLASLVRAVYDPPDGQRGGTRWAAENAGRWLRFLAAQSQQDDDAIRWWQLHRRYQFVLIAVYGALFVCIAGATAGLSRELGTALIAGGLWGAACGGGFTVGYGFQRRTERERRQVHRSGFRPDAGLRITWLRFARVLPVLLLAAAAVQAVGGLLRPVGDDGSLWTVLGQGMLVATGLGLVGGSAAGLILMRGALLAAKVTPAHSANPSQLLTRDRWSTGAVAVCCLAAVGLSGVAAWWFGARSLVPWGFALTAAGAGAVLGPMMFTAWPVFRATHAAYVVAGLLPVSYTAFLDRARAGGILRIDGMVHRFRHTLLRQSLLNDLGTPEQLRRDRLGLNRFETNARRAPGT
ncbi:hypothetical protein [Streptomyces sp. NPDC001843]|uniref:hypothetical protein n=1 Tax=Streptomyces sp. NPDC001843 TaxID=3364617 RepID=UPI0036986106